MDHVRESLADFNFVQKYARYDATKGRRETWEEACDRVLQMHLTRYADRGPVVHALLREASKAEKEKRVLSSQRARQFGGDPVLRKPWRIYNCVTSYCDRVRFFAEAFWLLLCGCGVGFSVQPHHVNKLPPLISKEDWDNAERVTYVIEDTIEGWADALHTLVSARMGLTQDWGYTRPTFDYSKIRAKGAPLSVGGRAPGPEPLRLCLGAIERLLDASESRLKTIECFDIVMHASNAVLSGGVRRAASIALFSADDADMVNAKTGTWYVDNPQRARANISAVITPQTEKSTYDALFKATRQFGEPGFIFSESTEFMYNPCVEIGMVPMLITDEHGDVLDHYTLDHLESREWYESQGYTYESGWQACNLVEVNCALFKNDGEALDAVTQATVLATAQAGYTRSDYLTPVSQRILERESLIGVSLTGMANCPDIAFDPGWQTRAARVVKSTNARMAEHLGIRPATRTTCVKPSGNAAVLLQCASGVHFEYAPRYIRNVQVSGTNPVAQFFQKHNPSAVQPYAHRAPGTDDVVISFPVDARGDHTLYRKDVSACAFIDMVASTQKHWVEYGTREGQGVEALTHNVSNTILVHDDEWDDVRERLWDKRKTLTGISLLGAFGDYVYDQPPFREVVVHEFIDADDPHREAKLAELERWQSLRDTWVTVDYTLLKEKSDTTDMMGEVSCSGGACEFTLT